PEHEPNRGGQPRECGAEVLFDVKLRAASPQSDGQAAHDVQAEDPGPEADPRRRRLLRAERQRRPALLEAADRQVPRRAGDPRRRRHPPSLKVRSTKYEVRTKTGRGEVSLFVLRTSYFVLSREGRPSCSSSDARNA